MSSRSKTGIKIPNTKYMYALNLANNTQPRTNNQDYEMRSGIRQQQMNSMLRPKTIAGILYHHRHYTLKL